MGSSPLTRGKRVKTRDSRRPCGLIPAHAGKTITSRAARRCERAHPRSRGENRQATATATPGRGSSPLTRGKLFALTTGCTSVGAHPRSRGENSSLALCVVVATGSSPLTRGKQTFSCAVSFQSGLIPAHAGKTATQRPLSRSRGAHPRSRGENAGVTMHALRHRGSSPLTRGKLPYSEG